MSRGASCYDLSTQLSLQEVCFLSVHTKLSVRPCLTFSLVCLEANLNNNDFRPSTKGLFYGLFMFVVSYILEEILEKRVNLDGMTFGTEFCLWRHRRRIKEIKDISYASLLS